MNTEYQYVSIRNILSRVARHPLLQDIDLEAGIQYTIDFLGIVGVPAMFEDRQECVDIHNFRGELPCDIVQVVQIRDEKTKLPLTYMTDSFNKNSRPIPSRATFKTQNRTITTSFPEGTVLVSYKAVKTDGDGLPMLPDDATFLRALEAYIKLTRFTVLFDTGKIKGDVLSKAEQDYTWAVGKCANRFKMPSHSEMQSIVNMMTRMIPSTSEFYAGFKGMGDKEFYKVHN